MRGLLAAAAVAMASMGSAAVAAGNAVKSFTGSSTRKRRPYGTDQYVPYDSAPSTLNGGRRIAGNRAHQRAAQKKRNQARHRKACRG